MQNEDCPGIYFYSQKIVCVISFEWFLSGNKANGGTIIFLRALAITLTITAIAMVLNNLINPKLILPIKWINFRQQIVDLSPWSAALFAGAYLALYTRFSAQWSYLANLYNMIKQAEISMYASTADAKQRNRQKDILGQWKAGYIEDAIELHLAGKSNVAGIILAWGRDPRVRKEFCNNTFNGHVLWDRIMLDANEVKIREEKGVKPNPEK